jgi:hypothetical protein
MRTLQDKVKQIKDKIYDTGTWAMEDNGRPGSSGGVQDESGRGVGRGAQHGQEQCDQLQGGGRAHLDLPGKRQIDCKTNSFVIGTQGVEVQGGVPDQGGSEAHDEQGQQDGAHVGGGQGQYGSIAQGGVQGADSQQCVEWYVSTGPAVHDAEGHQPGQGQDQQCDGAQGGGVDCGEQEGDVGHRDEVERGAGGSKGGRGRKVSAKKVTEGIEPGIV